MSASIYCILIVVTFIVIIVPAFGTVDYVTGYRTAVAGIIRGSDSNGIQLGSGEGEPLAEGAIFDSGSVGFFVVTYCVSTG